MLNTYFQNKEHGYVLSYNKMLEEITNKYNSHADAWAEYYTAIGSHE